MTLTAKRKQMQQALTGFVKTNPGTTVLGDVGSKPAARLGHSEFATIRAESAGSQVKPGDSAGSESSSPSTGSGSSGSSSARSGSVHGDSARSGSVDSRASKGRR